MIESKIGLKSNASAKYEVSFPDLCFCDFDCACLRKSCCMALEQSISDLLGLPNGIDDFADKRNNELLHEQLFYEDETKYPNNSIGWSSGGKNPLFGKGDFLHEPFSNGYVVTSSGYNDCVMHKAEKLVGKPPHYLLVGPILFYQQNNCQDWAQRLRDKYYELLGDPKVVCECGLHILIVR